MIENVNPKILNQFIKDRIKDETKSFESMGKYQKYYEGEHDILQRQPKSDTSPNNKLVLNYTKLIVDTNWNYLFAKPISYDAANDDPKTLEFHRQLVDIFFRNDEPTISATEGKDCGALGKSVEVMYIYQPEGSQEAEIRFQRSNPMNWVFYDLNGEKQALHFFDDYEYTFTAKGYERTKVTNYEIYTPTTIFKYKSVNDKLEEVGRVQHFFGETPATLIDNEANLGGVGDSDIKQVISINDALNATNSDLQNIIEKNAEPILLLKNLTLDITNLEQMKKNRILSFTSDPQVQSDIKNHIYDGDLTFVREHIKFLVQNILLLSMTPDLFSEEGQKLGTQSADAIQLKMHATESKSSGKIINFTKSLRKRIRMIARQLENAGKGNFYTDRTYEDINITFNKTIPENIGGIIEALVKGVGLFSKQTLLSQAPFVESVSEEMKRTEEEQSVTGYTFGDDVNE